jgi:hypothetical protein
MINTINTDLTLDRVVTDSSIAILSKNGFGSEENPKSASLMTPQDVVLRADDVLVHRAAAPNIEGKEHPGNVKFQALIKYYCNLLETYSLEDPSFLIGMLYFEITELGRRFLSQCCNAESDTSQMSQGQAYIILSKKEAYDVIRNALSNGYFVAESSPTSCLKEDNAVVVTPFSSPISPTKYRNVRVHEKSGARSQGLVPVVECDEERLTLEAPKLNYSSVGCIDSVATSHEALDAVDKSGDDAQSTNNLVSSSTKAFPFDLDYIKSKLDELVGELTDQTTEGAASDVAAKSKSRKKGTSASQAGNKAMPTLSQSLDIDEEEFSRVQLDARDVIVGRTCKSALHFCTRGHSGNVTYRRFIEHTSYLLKNSSPEDHSFLIRALFNEIPATCGRFVRLIKQERGVRSRDMNLLCSLVSDEDVLVVIQMDLSLLADMPVIPLGERAGTGRATSTSWVSTAQIQHLIKKQLNAPADSLCGEIADKTKTRGNEIADAPVTPGRKKRTLDPDPDEMTHTSKTHARKGTKLAP